MKIKSDSTPEQNVFTELFSESEIIVCDGEMVFAANSENVVERVATGGKWLPETIVILRSKEASTYLLLEALEAVRQCLEMELEDALLHAPSLRLN